MKILITGGAGFIGSQLGYYLHKKGHDITLVDDMSFGHEDNLIVNGEKFGTFFKYDVRDKNISEIISENEIIYHFAGISSLPVCQEEPCRAMDVNLQGTINVLEACRKQKIKKFIFASTSAIYENNTLFPTTDIDTLNPPHLFYSQSKWFAEEVCRSYYKLYKMPISIMRFFNVYGPHQDFRRLSPPFLGYVIKCFLNNEVPILHSTGQQKRDYIFVNDLIELLEIVTFSDNTNGESINACSGNNYSVNELYELISKEFPEKNIQPIFRDANLLWDKYINLSNKHYNLGSNYIDKEVNKYSLGKINNTLFDWSPKTSIESGIKLTVDYCKNYGLI